MKAMQDETLRQPNAGKFDWRLFAPLLCHLVVTHTLIGIVRVTTSYRTIELHLPAFWTGGVAAGFAVLPILLAVQIGRYIDRGNDARAVWIGSVLCFGPCLALWAWPLTGAHLFAFTVVLGCGHMFLMAAHQVLTIRCASAEGREVALGYFMVANTLGQGLGPFIIGRLAGSATVPPTGPLFALSAAAAAVCVVVSFAIRPATRAAMKSTERPVLPIAALLRQPGVFGILIASSVTVTAGDLLVIYLPLLGAERSVDAHHVGQLLMVRSIAALGGRVAYARLIQVTGRTRLMVISTLTASIAFGLLAFPNLWLMYFAVVPIGLGLGIASTLTISSLIDLVATEARGTALTLRLTGNRLGLMSLPLVAGIVTSAVGTFGVLVLIAAGLGASAFGIRRGKSSATAASTLPRRSVGI
jgi:MFS family permease